MKTVYGKCVFVITFASLMIYGCKKKDNDSPLHKYAKNMVGAHVWVGTFYKSGTAAPGYSGDTTYSISYTDSINIVNDSLLILHSIPNGYDTIRYAFTTEHKLVFAYSMSYSYAFYVWDTLKYDYVSAVITRKSYSTDRYSSTSMSVHTP